MRTMRWIWKILLHSLFLPPLHVISVSLNTNGSSMETEIRALPKVSCEIKPSRENKANFQVNMMNSEHNRTHLPETSFQVSASSCTSSSHVPSDRKGLKGCSKANAVLTLGRSALPVDGGHIECTHYHRVTERACTLHPLIASAHTMSTHRP